MSNNFRACAPGETLERVLPFLPRLGITRVSRQTGLDRIGIPVWSAFAPNSRAIAIAQGKGFDDISAKTSAVMEAIERAVATNPGIQAITTSRDELARQGRKTDCLDILLSSHGKPITADEPIRWVEAVDLTGTTSVFIPFDAIHLDRTSHNPRFWISSDGLASGNNWQEAALHGLLERIERDACVLSDVTSAVARHGRRIGLESVGNEEAASLVRQVRSRGYELAVFDLTTDLAIPAIAALLRPEGEKLALRYADVTFGAGASLYPGIAMARAICEAVQSRMTFIAGARDDLDAGMFSRPADPAHLNSFKASFTIDENELPVISANSSAEALSKIVDRLVERGITQLYAVELASAWLPASVVKVFAPQLEHPDGNRRVRFGSRALSRAFL